MAITASLTLLPRADGSATFKSGLTSAIVSISGPMEVKPRDELPDRTFIEVIVRPAIGVGGTRERALESKLHAALSPLIIRTHHPRTLLQINVQLVEAQDHTDAGALLPVCINAASLALADAGTPLRGVAVATPVFVREGGDVVEVLERGDAAWRSRHVLAFVGGKCVFVDSQGEFDGGEFARVVEAGMAECALGDGDGGGDADVEMSGGGRETVGRVVKRAVEGKVQGDMRWREQ